MTSAFWFFIGFCFGWVAFSAAASAARNPRHRRRIRERKIDLWTVQFP